MCIHLQRSDYTPNTIIMAAPMCHMTNTKYEFLLIATYYFVSIFKKTYFSNRIIGQDESGPL